MIMRREISYQSAINEIQDSQDSNQKTRRMSLSMKPLNLNKQQLQKRLGTLLNYNTWKSTKPLRINLKQINTTVKQPTINVAVSYGNTNSNNQVLQEFLQHVGVGDKKVTDHQNLNMSLSRCKESINRAQIERDPSFLNFKRSYREVDKIYKMIPPKIHMKARFGRPSQRTKTQSISLKQNKRVHQHVPYPKELKKLKNKLKGITSFSSHQKQIPSRISQHQKQTQQLVTIDSSLHKISVNSIKRQTKGLFNRIGQGLTEQKSMRPGRRQYREQISRILDRSLCFLQGRDHHADELKVSNLSMHSEQAIHNINTPNHQKLSKQIQSQKPHPYWPSHPNNIEHIYYQQMQKISKRYKERIQSGLDIHQQQKQILKIIKDDFRAQQQQFDRQIIKEERQAFAKKFQYKLGLQRQNYKRNIKQLLRCKKEYYLQKQREQIRANGIINIKKIQDSSSKKKIKHEKPVSQASNQFQ